MPLYGGDVIASLPFYVRRLVFDNENAVAVINQLRAVWKQQRLQPGGIAGGRTADGVRHIIAARDEARPRVRRTGYGIGWIVHVVLKWSALRDSNPRPSPYKEPALTG